MTDRTFYDSIAGLTGREPVGGVLRIGKKDGRGIPTDRDRFYICSPGLDENKVRPLHPSFVRFNKAAPEHRRVIRGNLYHSSPADAWNHHLQAYALGAPWKTPPSREPACRGDGVKATRWYADADKPEGGEWREQKGCGDLCEFRQEGNRKCKPSGRLYFRISWRASALQSHDGIDGLPEILLRYDTGSWNTCANIKGFFDRVSGMADDLKMGDYSLMGLPFVLELGTKTRKNRAFPVVTMTPDGDLVRFFQQQREALDSIQQAPQLVGARSPEENEPEVVEVTAIELSAPGIPGQGGLFK